MTFNELLFSYYPYYIDNLYYIFLNYIFLFRIFTFLYISLFINFSLLFTYISFSFKPKIKLSNSIYSLNYLPINIKIYFDPFMAHLLFNSILFFQYNINKHFFYYRFYFSIFMILNLFLNFFIFLFHQLDDL